MTRPPPTSTLFPYTTLFRSGLTICCLYAGLAGQGRAYRDRTLPRPGPGTRLRHLANYCRSEEHTSELQSRPHLVCRLLLEKKKKKNTLDIQKRSDVIV